MLLRYYGHLAEFGYCKYLILHFLGTLRQHIWLVWPRYGYFWFDYVSPNTDHVLTKLSWYATEEYQKGTIRLYLLLHWTGKSRVFEILTAVGSCCCTDSLKRIKQVSRMVVHRPFRACWLGVNTLSCEHDVLFALASLHAFSKAFYLCYHSDQSRPLCRTMEIWRCLWCMNRVRSPTKTKRRKGNQAESYISS